jgi:nicotinamide mononucleotide transporter
MSWQETFYTQIIETSFLEWLAVLCALAYVYYASRQKLICWLFALLSSGIYLGLMWSVQLYLEAGLQLFYVLMALYGWRKWLSGQSNNSSIIRWSIQKHLVNIGLSGLVTLFLGYVMSEFTNQAAPCLDAFTTVFSLAATWMVALRILENWVYWIVIDAVSVLLYADRGLFLSSSLMVFYVILATWGLYSWTKQWKQQAHFA